MEPAVPDRKIVFKGPPGSDVADLIVADMGGIDGLMSEWEFSAVERAAILAGANLRLWVLADRHPVIAIAVVGASE